MQIADMRTKIEQGQGFIAALDQSGGSTPKALKGYGIEEGAWSSDEEMFGLIHDMRVRIITSPAFTGEKVIGAILFERTMDGEADGKPVPQALQDRGVVPFIKIDKGLEAEENGVQLMKPMACSGPRSGPSSISRTARGSPPSLTSSSKWLSRCSRPGWSRSSSPRSTSRARSGAGPTGSCWRN
jgi:hypothetical protein